MSSNSMYIGLREVHGHRNEYGMGTAVEGGLEKEEVACWSGNAAPANAAERLRGRRTRAGTWWAEPCCHGVLLHQGMCQPVCCFPGLDRPPG